MSINDRSKKAGVAGFTLIEVVLTLSMAVMLMTLVGSTLSFYANNMNVKDMDVRRIHLASSVLQMIADDLRAAIHGTTFDDSTLDSFLTSAVGGQVAQAVGLDADAAETLGLGSTDLAVETLPATSDLIASTLTLATPGMIGNQTQIQFDISRLPRVEQYQAQFSATPGVMADVPSDVKTITYYVQPPGTVGGIIDPIQQYLADAGMNRPESGGGLIRRQLDRSANNYATDTGGIAGLLMTGEMIAGEVTAISFEYFDGTLWQITWNSDQMEQMPKAIRIRMSIGGAPGDDNVPAAQSPRTFTHTVLMPVGINAPSSSSASSSADATTATAPATNPAAGATTGTSPAGGN